MEFPQVVVAVLVTSTVGGLLLGRDAKSKQWALPYGVIPKFQAIQTVGETAVRELTGASVQVMGSIFISENIIPPHEHQVVVVALGKLLTDFEGTTLIPDGNIFSEVRWVDFRQLGEIQDEIDNVTADAIMKFGLYLQGKTRAAQQ
jgi:ADP-ribose pyrophosphatase YjhB (NUDIX family)